jgi:hypothetical protein
MKLANLFLITALVSVLGAIGCTTDSGNGNGNGGTGGDGAAGNGGTGGAAADACTSGECETSGTDVQTACGAVKDFCNDPACCNVPGTGGTGGTMMIDPSEADCDDVGQLVCILGAGGTGGTGGTGGAGATCDDFNAQEVCSLCTVDNLKPACEDAFANCLVADPGGNVCEKCAVFALGESECFEIIE